MTADEKTLTVVYQFGKVASTSLVNTLKKNPKLDVHQSHFLGESALTRIIPIAVDKSTSAYFHEHLRGQLLANVDLTYRMNQVLAGHTAHRLKVISLSREPLDWLRSGILQDITGYRTDLLEHAATIGEAADDEAETMRKGLVAVLARIVTLIDEIGGTEETVRLFHDVGGRGMLEPVGADIAPIVRKLFFLSLRPLTWFEEHFQQCFALGLADLDRAGRIWTAQLPRADIAVLRYEDLEDGLKDVFTALSIEDVGPLLHDNISRTKPYANVVSAAFSSSAAEALRARLRASEYARFFDYATGAAQAGTAAE